MVMPVAVILFSILGAFLNASAAVLQRQATGQLPADALFRVHTVREAITSRLWLIGVGLQIAGFFAQAGALTQGSLAVVEPLLTTDVIFLLALMHFGLNIRVGLREWGAMILLSAGLGTMLAAANVRGGVTAIGFPHWLVAFIIIGALVVSGAIAMRRLPPSRLRALIGGVTGGIHFAFTAVVAKLMIDELQYGVLHEFVSWQLYALIIVGVTSALTMQSMYGAGPLAISQPAVEITDASLGVIMALVLFGDSINHTAWALVAEIGGAVLLTIGIILLAGSHRLQDPYAAKHGHAEQTEAAAG